MPLRAIYLGTFSKTLYPELRMGYRVLLPTLVPVKTLRQAAMAGIQLLGLSQLYAGEPKQQGWLLGYACLSGHDIDMSVLRLSNALKPARHVAHSFQVL